MKLLQVLFLLIYIIFTFPSNAESEIGGWKMQNTSTHSNLNDIYFIDSLTGWVCGDSGSILKTSNGGNNWTYIHSVNIDKIYSISFKTNQLGYCSGSNGTILKTIDGGNNWTVLLTGIECTFYYLKYVNDSTAYAVGSTPYGSTFSYTVVYKTLNSGSNWNIVFTSDRNHTKSGYFSSSDSGIIFLISNVSKIILFGTGIVVPDIRMCHIGVRGIKNSWR